ncbi:MULTISPECIES: response regulator transcription factor [Methylosinus]|uniref:response regulator transcription factor n=1 Tax=Methylosinus TaxID=425 RepID=UPI0003A38194|nr:response regulator transcription factor [Methylosinus sp. LW4]
MKILLVEDEPDMSRLLSSLLKGAGFVVDHATSIREAEEATRQFVYDLNLLDRRLPDGDGAELIPRIRALRPGARVMMLTALDSLTSKVAGLEAGADDYLTKPFQGEELIARVRACLRRPGSAVLPPIRVGALSFDPETRALTIDDKPLPLRRRELNLLEALIRRANRVVTREALLNEVFSSEDEVQANAIDTLVSRLRQRLSSPGANVTILTARGIGYMLTEDSA